MIVSYERYQEGITHLVGNTVAVPGDHVKGAMVLLNGDVLSIVLYYNGKWHVQVFVNMGDGEQKVSRVGKAMASQRAKVWQLPSRPPNLGDVATSNRRAFSQVDPKADSALNDADLARLDKELAHFCLDV